MGALAQMAETKGHCRLSEQIVRGAFPAGSMSRHPWQAQCTTTNQSGRLNRTRAFSSRRASLQMAILWCRRQKIAVPILAGE